MTEHILTSLTKDELQDIVAKCLATELQKVTQSNQPLTQGKTLLSIEEVVSEFNVSRTTLYTWRKKRLLPYSRIGRLLFVNRNDLLSLIESQKHNGGQP